MITQWISGYPSDKPLGYPSRFLFHNSQAQPTGHVSQVYVGTESGGFAQLPAMMFLSGPRILRFWKSFGNRHGTNNFLVFETPNRRKTPKNYNKTHGLCGLMFKKRLLKVNFFCHENLWQDSIRPLSQEFSCIFSQRQLTISRLREIAFAQPREAPLKKKTKQLWDSQVDLKMEHMIAYAICFFLKKEHDDKLLKLYNPI